MPIQITISGDTAVEALRELQGLSSGLTAPAAKVEPAPAPQVAEEVPAAEEKTFPEPAKTTRKPRAAKVEPQDAPRPSPELVAEAQGRFAEGNLYGELDGPAEPEAEQPEETDKPFTVDDARTALSDLLKQPDGKTKAQAVFAETGCTKLSEIPEGSYKAFIAAIAKARGL